MKPNPHVEQKGRIEEIAAALKKALGDRNSSLYPGYYANQVPTESHELNNWDADSAEATPVYDDVRGVLPHLQVRFLINPQEGRDARISVHLSSLTPEMALKLAQWLATED